MMHNSHRWRKSLILLGDIVVLYVSLWLMLLVRYQALPSPERWGQHARPFSFVFLVYLSSFAVVGLYQLAIARNSRAFHQALGAAMVAATSIAAVFFYLVRPGITPRLNLLIFVALTALLVTLWRRALNAVLGSALLVRTLILGFTRDAAELARTLAHNPQLGYALAVLILDPSEASRRAQLDDTRVPVRICAPHELLAFIDAERIELVIPATDAHLTPALVSALYARGDDRVTVGDLPSMFEAATGKVPVQSVSERWFLAHADIRAKPFYEFAKRAGDLLLSFAALILTIPLAPLIYLTVKLDSRGSGFFTQHRVGRDGKIFLAVKFRSMFWDSGGKGPSTPPVPTDPRITRIGKFLRKTRLDELPQLWNIFKGDMSFVGPRPEQTALADSLSKEIPFYRERLSVKPGLTGWDQISGAYHSASVEDTLEKLQYDLYYIKNRSLILDFTILLRTIKTVLLAQGR